MSLEKIWKYEEERNFPGMVTIKDGKEKTFDDYLKEVRAENEKEASKEKDK